MTSLAKPLVMKAVTETPSARAWLESASAPCVMHVFDRAVNLYDDEAGVLSLVGHLLGAEPFAIVIQPARRVDSRPRFADWLDADSPVKIEPAKLSAGRIHVLLNGAQLWDPLLPWDDLRAKRERILAWKETLTGLLGSSAPAGGLAGLAVDDDRGRQAPGVVAQAIVDRARGPALGLVDSLAQGDNDAAIIAARQLAGLGGGLTPSGDDFIVGAMYALRLVGDWAWADQTGRVLAEAAGPKTVRISQAWLDAAARGEASMTWHRMCQAVMGDDEARVEAAARDLLAVGHTSGADALTGFLLVVRAFS
jgi:hypothetical protein